MMNLSLSKSVNNQKLHRGIAALVLFAIAALIIGSTVFIVLSSDHHCISDGCRICRLMLGTVTSLNIFGHNVLLLSFNLLSCAGFLLSGSFIALVQSCAFNPVKMKVRLIN